MYHSLPDRSEKKITIRTVCAELGLCPWGNIMTIVDSISYYLPGFIAAYAILLVGASSPGPSVALLVNQATQHGRYAALLTTFGIACGSATLNIATLLGIELLFSHAAWVVTVLRLVGAAYLLYLAYGAFRNAFNPPKWHPADSLQSAGMNSFVSGYALQVTNVKAMSFWLSISAIGAVEGAPAVVKIAFVVGSFLISFTCHGAWALALSSDRFQQAYSSARRWVEVLLGCCFSFFAYRLASADH